MMGINRSCIALICFFLSSCGSTTGAITTHEHLVTQATQDKHVSSGGFDKVADTYVLAREITGLEANEIKQLYEVKGSDNTLIKIDMASIPCSILLKKNTGQSSEIWLITDMGCNEYL
ncbi:hypothetical protein NOM80_17400 [Proteus mirabilis]|uniref:hypothetical protein n=1 Tax=Proteus mirabilis TaxID=584 RepID=UPI00217CD6E5|nr:hypothetical protein [Proteus mirabilis]MCS6738030.1 hypothetical protein [Proteus mirabilis]